MFWLNTIFRSGGSELVSFGEFLGLGCAFIWALNVLIIKSQLGSVPPALLNAVRCGVATVFFWLLLPFELPLTYGEVTLGEWGLLIGSVVIGIVIGDTLYLIAIKEIGVSRSLPLVGIHPLATLFFEHLWLGSPFGWSFVLGTCLVTAGVICLSMRTKKLAVVQSGGQPVRLLFGVFLSILAAILWGLSTVMIKPALAHLTVVQANSIRLPVVAALLFWVHRWGESGPGLKEMGRRSLIILAGAGILGIGLGSMMFLTAIDLVGPAKTATLVSAMPVFGLIMSVIFLKEEVNGTLVLGVVLCVTGVWLVL